MKKRVATIIAYLLLTAILMWLAPFLSFMFSAMVYVNSIILFLIVFTVQMIITYKMRCAWAWVWVNAIYWLVFFLLLSVLQSIGDAGLGIWVTYCSWYMSFAMNGGSLGACIVLAIMYAASFIVQLFLEYRRRRIEAADVAVIDEVAGNSEQEGNAIEKDVDA